MIVAASESGRNGASRQQLDALQLPAIAPDVVAAYRPQAEDLSRRVCERICREVAAFSDPALRPLVKKAIAGAVAFFVDALAGAPVRGAEVSEHYRRLGRAKGKAGHDLDAVRAAHHVATQETRREVRRIGEEFALSSETVSALGTAVLDFQDELHRQATAGWAEGRYRRSQSRESAQERLLEALLGHSTHEEIVAAAGEWWCVPDAIAVAATHLSDVTAELATELSRRSDVVCGTRRGHVVVVADACQIDQLAETMARRTPHPVALSWGVVPAEGHHALRWVKRALRLVREGVIPVDSSRIVRCQDYRPDLALHADPLLVQRVAEEVLAPLFTEKPHQRSELSETLLLWLRSRDSAPVLAKQLGVHDQTVRHRLRRLRSLFGDKLDNPADSAELLQALQAMLGATKSCTRSTQ